MSMTKRIFMNRWRMKDFANVDDDSEDFLSYIFSVSENTKTIHLIMMIWLFSFIISSYKIVSSPPQDPGGSKKILSKSGYDS